MDRIESPWGIPVPLTSGPANEVLPKQSVVKLADAVAFFESVIDVPETIEAIVVPGGMPVPETVSPTARGADRELFLSGSFEWEIGKKDGLITLYLGDICVWRKITGALTQSPTATWPTELKFVIALLYRLKSPVAPMVCSRPVIVLLPLATLPYSQVGARVRGSVNVKE